MLQHVFWWWEYKIIYSSVPHLWCIVLSPQSSWFLLCIRCCNVEKYQVLKGGICEATISHIPIGLNWWGWRGRWVTCFDCRRWNLSIIWRGLPFMHLLLPGMCWCHNRLIESMICIYPSTWSDWQRWKIILSLWWYLFLCTFYFLFPHVCVSVYHFIFSGGPGCS